jgi:hypothetical protein
MPPEKTEEQELQERKDAAVRANKERNDARLERLNQIANQSDESKTKDGLTDLADDAWEERASGRQPHEGDEEEEEEDSSRIVADAEAADRAAEEARQVGATDTKVVNGETYYQLIVNGQEKWKTLAEIRADAQKVISADGYLHDAKEAVKKALALTPSEPTRQDEEANTRKARMRDLLSRAMMGEQEAIDELASTLGTQPSEVTPDAVRLVDERVDGRLKFLDAVKWFDAEYSDELADPNLKARIVKRDKEIATLYPDMDFKDRLKEVGDEARALRIAAGGKPKVAPGQTKEARKASVRPPVPAAATRQEPEEEEGDESVGDAIAKMAAARGQSRPIIHRR